MCRRFRNPSILDVKIGRVSYDPEADEKKRSAEMAKYPPLAKLGFQLLGMRVRFAQILLVFLLKSKQCMS